MNRYRRIVAIGIILIALSVVFADTFGDKASWLRMALIAMSGVFLIYGLKNQDKERSQDK